MAVNMKQCRVNNKKYKGNILAAKLIYWYAVRQKKVEDDIKQVPVN